jgi:hypothetical protein
VAVALPDLIIFQLLVRKACQAEAGVGDADLLLVIRENLSGDVNKESSRSSTISLAWSRP